LHFCDNSNQTYFTVVGPSVASLINSFSARHDLHNFFDYKRNNQLISCSMPSAVVAAIKYDAHSSTLRVIYTSSMVYDYKNVPEEVFTAMKTSFSKGAFLNQYIKGKYAYEKIKEQVNNYTCFLSIPFTELLCQSVQIVLKEDPQTTSIQNEDLTIKIKYWLRFFGNQKHWIIFFETTFLIIHSLMKGYRSLFF